MDVMQIELENNSAPSLKDFIEKNNIQGIGFDLDSTLIDTTGYFDMALIMTGMAVAERMESTVVNEEIAIEIRNIAREIYLENGNKPILLTELFHKAISRYRSEEFALETDSVVSDVLSFVYINSPDLYPETEKVLRYLKSLDFPVVVHSHSQQEWMNVKMNMIKEKTGIKLPSLATDINGEKDSQSWKDATSLLGLDISEMLIVGDSLTSDILPALEAGCKHVVWLNHLGKELPEELKDRVHVITKIGDLLYL